MLRAQLTRLAALGLCVSLLIGLLVLGGTAWPEDPEAGPGIDLEDPAVDPADEPGAFAETSGIVVSTDPVVIAVEQEDGTMLFVEVEDAPPVEVGEQLIVAGTLTEDASLEADRDRAVTREPWEVTYMYLISLVGALLVAAAGLDSWRLDPRTLTVEPRDRPLHHALLDDGGESGG